MLTKLEKIFEDIRNNDHRSLENYLIIQIEPSLNNIKDKNGDKYSYLGLTNVDFSFDCIKNDQYEVLEKAIKILKMNIENKYGNEVLCWTFVMTELLPQRIGIEVWVYKENSTRD